MTAIAIYLRYSVKIWSNINWRLFDITVLSIVYFYSHYFLKWGSKSFSYSLTYGDHDTQWMADTPVSQWLKYTLIIEWLKDTSVTQKLKDTPLTQRLKDTCITQWLTDIYVNQWRTYIYVSQWIIYIYFNQSL